MNNGKMFVCRTNAFNPMCDNLTFKYGNLSFEGTSMSGKGKLPFNPNLRFASLMDNDTLYSVSASNFLGTWKAFQRHELNPINNEYKQSVLYEPTMISLNLIETSKHSDNREEDSVFLFFTENAVEEHRETLPVPRVARVCKNDLGGMRTLYRKWTSFLKARLQCLFGDIGSRPLMQDVFFL